MDRESAFQTASDPCRSSLRGHRGRHQAAAQILENPIGLETPCETPEHYLPDPEIELANEAYGDQQHAQVEGGMRTFHDIEVISLDSDSSRSDTRGALRIADHQRSETVGALFNQQPHRETGGVAPQAKKQVTSEIGS